VLEDFARTGGIAVANVIMADFAKRAAEEFSKDEVPAAETPPPPSAEPAAPLAAGSLFWVVVKAYWHRLLQALGIARG
jgi:hypothetical protein